MDLDAPIGDFVPELRAAYSGRAVGSLLNHRSGLADYSELPEYKLSVSSGDRAWPVPELLERCIALKHDNADFHYSNIGYLLLRMGLQRVSGKSYFSSISELVLQPLGIEGFAEWVEPLDSMPDYDPRWVYSGTFLAEPQAIGPALAKLASHRQSTIGLTAGLFPVPVANSGFDSPGYSFGFMSDGNPPTMVGHGGGGPGFQLMALVKASDWSSDIQVSTKGDLDQAKAILELKQKLSAKD